MNRVLWLHCLQTFRTVFDKYRFLIAITIPLSNMAVGYVVYVKLLAPKLYFLNFSTPVCRM